MSYKRPLINLEVRNFRKFELLKLTGLSRVNLFVGRNNTGKTTLLEAIQLYFADDNIPRLGEILISRDEFSFSRRRKLPARLDRDPPLAFESLFYGRPAQDSFPEFSIGPADSSQDLSVRLIWVRRIVDSTTSSIRYEPGLFEEIDTDPDIVAGFEIISASGRSILPVERIDRLSMRRRQASATDTSVVYLPSSGMSSEEIGRVWDTVALTEDEDVVIESLRCIVPSLEKLVLVSAPNSRFERVLMARLSEFREPVPFRSLGEGAIHLLGISLALIRARGGVLLADEIENVVHYSVQSHLWNLVFRQAQHWDIQVFSTTHSWDCVLGFKEAAKAIDRPLSSLFRLELGRKGVRAVRFTPDELEVADREDIELR